MVVAPAAVRRSTKGPRTASGLSHVTAWEESPYQALVPWVVKWVDRRSGVWVCQMRPCQSLGFWRRHSHRSASRYIIHDTKQLSYAVGTTCVPCTVRRAIPCTYETAASSAYEQPVDVLSARRCCSRPVPRVQVMSKHLSLMVAGEGQTRVARGPVIECMDMATEVL